MSEAINPTYDLAHQDAALERRRKMAMVMMQQAMEPLQQQTAGGYVVPISPMQGIGKIAQALIARSELDSADRDTAAADRNFAARLAEATNSYSRMRQTDPMGAFKAAMGSGIKPLMQMAMQDLKASQLNAKDQMALYEKYTPESIAARMKDPTAALVPLPKIMAVNDQVAAVSPTTGNVIQKPTDMRTTYGIVKQDPISGIPMQFANQTGEAKSFTGGNVTPAAAVGNREFELEAAKANVGRVKDTHGKMLEAVATFQRIADVKNLLADGAKTGPLTDARVYAAKLADSLGLPYSPDTPTELLIQQLGEGVLQDARKLAPVTENDIKMLEKIKGGSVTGIQALQGAMDVLERSAVRAYQDHSQALSALPNNPSMPATASLRESLAPPAFTTQVIDSRAAPAEKPGSRIKFLGFKGAQ